ncbi:MAG: N-formylglutamate amidohydrolase [Endozoicomonas sp.]|uniref:N-formylglutamate amidohydrolase n=1 Tax=Endozoicomonas sp. TaxID=1892382 RepID=UPI003D9ACEC2
MEGLSINKAESPWIFSLPHSGMTLTEEAKRNLLPEPYGRLPNMDWHLRELYDFLKELPVSMISTDISRYIVDLNRSPESNLLGDFRSSLAYQKNTWGEEIYRTYPSEIEIQERIKQYYEPYHEALDNLVESALSQFGKAYLFDLHSFMGPIECDVCLGNLDNQSSSLQWLNVVHNIFEDHGFDTAKNDFYKGGYITAKYRDTPKVQAIQIELRYTNYLSPEDYETRRPPQLGGEKFQMTKDRLHQVFKTLFSQSKKDPQEAFQTNNKHYG